MKALTYSYQFDDAILAIKDQRGGKSVFMFVDEVLAQIRLEIGPLLIRHILWQGEDGLWDLLLPEANRGELGMVIHPIGAQTLPQAKAKLTELLARGEILGIVP